MNRHESISGDWCPFVNSVARGEAGTRCHHAKCTDGVDVVLKIP